MISLLDLPYDYDALEPHIDAKTMEVHYSKHHQGYVDKTNAVLAETPWSEKPIEEIITNLDKIPENIRSTVKNVGGGVFNHNIFWISMSPNGGGGPNGNFLNAINDSFESFEKFKKEFSNSAVTLFGSGWVWLVQSSENEINKSRLQIITTQNQDSPLTLGLSPILALDVWEHAYYLKYQNRRLEYIDSWWQVVDWEGVGRRFESISL